MPSTGSQSALKAQASLHFDETWIECAGGVTAEDVTVSAAQTNA